MTLAASAAAQVPEGYAIVPAPAAERGIYRPIAGDVAYGYSYLSPRGWFAATLPRGATMSSVKPDTVSFKMTSGGHEAICVAVAYPEAQRRPERLDQLQLRVDALLTPGGAYDRMAREALSVTESGVLPLRDDGRIPVKLAAWTGTQANGRYMTMALVELPVGLLSLACEAPTAAKAKFLTTMVFRIAEGGL
ncbi:MAG: hypothetical protein Q8J89_01130 [Caulobacter sp.]|nr:hypothetical protein [Caulobacter sp.]